MDCFSDANAQPGFFFFLLMRGLLILKPFKISLLEPPTPSYPCLFHLTTPLLYYELEDMFPPKCL